VKRKNILNWLYCCFNQRGEKRHTVYTADQGYIAEKNSPKFNGHSTPFKKIF